MKEFLHNPRETVDQISDQERVVIARGTEDGLVLRIDGRAEWRGIVTEIELYLNEKRTFFQGGEVSLEWLERLPTKEQSTELEALLRSEYGIEIIGRRKKISSHNKTLENEITDDLDIQELDLKEANAGVSKAVVKDKKKRVVKKEGNTISLFDLAGQFSATAKASAPSSSVLKKSGSGKYLDRMDKMFAEEILLEEEANARIVFGTLRSGQKIETPFSLVIIGDVNPGADLIAGGDIIVFGSLKGTAHAAAYDDEAQDKVIIAMHMQPMQLRIGSIISRGSDDVAKTAEIARIEDRRIVVEVFNPRVHWGRKLR